MGREGESFSLTSMEGSKRKAYTEALGAGAKREKLHHFATNMVNISRKFSGRG